MEDMERMMMQRPGGGARGDQPTPDKCVLSDISICLIVIHPIPIVGKSSIYLRWLS